ncbi:hypothetical protein ALI144C_30210 [Actinosynnema sp. ALI-1.44]|uniref:DUF4129 domain-containing protein n=1 Tax=Actinosynnema sp. ALI-1.44 TaxID=1933779 RepID=UPI00097C8FC0|nr:DUF4129 domain-containing protein [Actinosynnema sp. ALI-1.44]ONI77727.1 hypothetical protein ALI144C_30210 [Actinosynnema sp. ALI-1.44]
MRVRLPVLLAVAACLVLAVVVSRGTSAIPTGVVDPGSQSGSQGSGGVPPDSPPVPDEFFGYGAGVLVVLVLVVALLGFALVLASLGGMRARRHKRIRQRAILADDAVDGESWLAAAGKRALLELDRKIGGPPSDAVIAAWVQLERSAAETGVERQPHQTPTEFTAAVLTEQNADEEALATLRTLYHRARFGKPGGITDDDARRARQALEQIT